MSNKEVLHTLKDDKQELQKQLGCMNGIFQIFDRRYLLGQRRHNQKRLPPGESDNGEKELKKTSEQPKEKTAKVVTKEKKRVSVDLPRNSFSSSSSSTAMSSSLDCSKRVQTELSSSSPFSHRKKTDLFIQSPDIRDVVKDSMTREPRVVSIKTGAKDERAMKHVDSPRPFPQQKPVETSRFSCDGRESSRYQLKSNMKVKELPRLSLDSRQGYISNAANDLITNKRSSSSVVARLMGLEALTSTIDENPTSKTKSEDSVLSSRKEEELKQDRSSVSPRVRNDSVSPQRGVKVNHVITRIPLETAPWKQEGRGQGLHKPPFKSKETAGSPRAEPASRSVYGEIEKRLTEHEFKTAGKDLRALKQILEAMHKTKKRLENKEDALDDTKIQKIDQPVSPTVNVTSPRKVKHAEVRKDSVGRQRLKELNLRDRKATTGRPLSPSNFLEYSGNLSPKIQRSKNRIHGTSSDSSRPKKQHGIQRAAFGSTTRNPKVKSVDLRQDSSESRNLSQLSDTVSYQSENDSEVTSTEWIQEVNSPFRPKENHRSIIAERPIEEKSTVDHAKHTMEQPSPVSVLDAFYTEDTPSPVKKKTNAFDDDENLHFEEIQDQEKMNKSANTNVHRYSEFDNMKLENIKILVHQIEQLNTNTDETDDHRYVEEILLASGCLKDLDRTTTIVQLHQPVGLINPDLFHVLEKTKGCTDDRYHKKNNTRSTIRRKLVFDTVNDVLCHKLATLGPFGPHKSRNLNENKVLNELWSEIDGLENNSERGVYDEDDEVLNIINADVNKRSQDWDEYCYQVPGLVLDIERMIFRDLISEVVNGQETDVQDWAVRPRCRQLFPM